jgi:hypothetical protein
MDGTDMPVAMPGGINGTITAYAAQFDKSYPGKNAGAAYTDYANAHPSLSPTQASSAFALEIALSGIDKAIASAVTGVGKLTGATPGGIVAGAKAVSQLNPLTGLDAIGNFFNKLGDASTWIRVAEVAVGLLLIAVGIAELTKAVPLATKIASVVK